MTEINNPLGPSPHIVKPIDHLVLPSYGLHVPCLLFPFINAEEMSTYLTKEQPSNDGLARRLTVAQQMCQALLHVHESGYIHGDISPKNFLLNPESDEVYLIDFETLTKTDGARQKPIGPTATTWLLKSTNPRAKRFPKPPMFGRLLLF